MEVLSTLYYDLMSKFPFSITGYGDDIESRISDFFTSFCNLPLNQKNKNISFIVGVFGQLDGLENINSPAIDKINNWETKRIKKFLFSTNVKDRPELIMSFYIYKLQSLLQNKYAINILTNNFRNDIDFRISLSNADNPECQFDDSEKIFEIKVPRSIFNEDIFKHTNEAKNKIRERLLNISGKNCLIVGQSKNNNQYELEIFEDTSNNDERLKHWDKVNAEFYCKSFEEFYESSKVFLLPELNLPNVKDKFFKNENINIEELLKIAYAGSFLCAYYGVSLEYILSTCRVVNDKYYGLGGLAVGVKEDSDFSKENRALYKIVSNYIARNISGEITFNLFSGEIYKEKASKYLSDLCKRDSPLINLTHFNGGDASKNITQFKNDSLAILESLVLKKIVSKETYSKATKLINNINVTTGIETTEKKELEQLFSLKLSELVSEVFKRNFPDAVTTISSASINSAITYYFDFYWLIQMLTRIPYSNFKTHVQPEGGILKIEVGAVDENGIPCNNTGGTPHHLQICFRDNGKGMDLPNCIADSLNSYALLFKGDDYHNLLQTHGKIIIHSKGKALSIFDLLKKEPLKESTITDGSLFEVLLKAK